MIDSLKKFSQRQLLTLVVFSIADFCNAICVSLQAPFYPQEAEKKGATATEYGLVFGVFELVVFLISPVYGQYLNRIGPKYLFNGGIFTTGICAILFGLLDRVETHIPFITLSFIIRIVEALGNAAFLTASFAIIAKEFPDNVATTFASLETFFGLGLIVGPTVGGALFEAGGYMTPFAVLGSALFLAAIMTSFVLPEHDDREHHDNEDVSLVRCLRIPGVLLAACSIVVTSMSIGFINVLLEPHMRQFDLSPMILGSMFVINGGTYAITAPCWGWVCDKKVVPKVVTIIGCVLLIIGFSLLGPAPFLPLDPSLGTTILGLVSHGLGIAALLVSSFTDALRTSVQNGFPNNLETYGMISGLWTSTFALGAAIGPSVAGILYDAWGFRNASLFVILLGIFVGIVVGLFLVMSRKRPLYTEIGVTEETPEIKLNGATSPTAILAPRDTSSCISAAPSSFERPPGMTGIIACNSYKNRHGNWHKRDCAAIPDSRYSASFSTFETRRHYDRI